METTTKVEDFKGHDILIITGVNEDNPHYPPEVRFGIKKAKLIVAEIEAIKRFITVQDGIKAKTVMDALRKDLEASK